MIQWMDDLQHVAATITKIIRCIIIDLLGHHLWIHVSLLLDHPVLLLQIVLITALLNLDRLLAIEEVGVGNNNSMLLMGKFEVLYLKKSY